MKPLVSAIILNYRTGRDAWTCARALLDQTIGQSADAPASAGGRLEILIVDNHSQDDSIGTIRNRSRGHPSIRVLETPRNIGYGQGNNLGMRHARGDYILIINPDNTLPPDGLERMVEVMEADPGIGILAPKLVHEDGTVRDSFRTFPTLFDLFIKRTALRRFFRTRMRRYLQHDQDLTLTRDTDWVAGACLLFRASLIEEIGGFDPRFFLFFEDTDLCRRCWAAGKRVVYFPTVEVRDRKHRLSEGGFLALFTKKTARIHLASALQYFWKWKGA